MVYRTSSGVFKENSKILPCFRLELQEVLFQNLAANLGRTWQDWVVPVSDAIVVLMSLNRALLTLRFGSFVLFCKRNFKIDMNDSK